MTWTIRATSSCRVISEVDLSEIDLSEIDLSEIDLSEMDERVGRMSDA
jgi:hypothetical protein